MKEKVVELRSRILEYFPQELMLKIHEIAFGKMVVHNNVRVKMIHDLLKEYKINYESLGSGTNRTAVLIGGYVFKIAYDKNGVIDNDREFALSPALEPLVIKTYETNGLISACEYVTLMPSKEEFRNREKDVMRILRSVCGDYLVGDVGFITKNYCNWGIRPGENELCILDFAYMYKIKEEHLICPCGGTFGYDKLYVDLVCNKCGTIYSFFDIRDQIPLDVEEKEILKAKQSATKLNKSSITVIEEVKSDDEEVEFNKIQPTDPVRKRAFRNYYYGTHDVGYMRYQEPTKLTNLEEEEKMSDDLDNPFLDMIDYSIQDNHDGSPGISKKYLDHIQEMKKNGHSIKITVIEPRAEHYRGAHKFKNRNNDNRHNENRSGPIDMRKVMEEQRQQKKQAQAPNAQQNNHNQHRQNQNTPPPQNNSPHQTLQGRTPPPQSKPEVVVQPQPEQKTYIRPLVPFTFADDVTNLIEDMMDKVFPGTKRVECFKPFVMDKDTPIIPGVTHVPNINVEDTQIPQPLYDSSIQVMVDESDNDTELDEDNEAILEKALIDSLSNPAITDDTIIEVLNEYGEIVYDILEKLQDQELKHRIFSIGVDIGVFEVDETDDEDESIDIQDTQNINRPPVTVPTEEDLSEYTLESSPSTSQVVEVVEKKASAEEAIKSTISEIQKQKTGFMIQPVVCSNDQKIKVKQHGGE